MNLWKHEILWNFHYIFYLLGRVRAQVGFVWNFCKTESKINHISRGSLIHGKNIILPDLYWNTTNPMWANRVGFFSWNENFIFRFLISNTDHIIDVNQATAIHEYDTINIVCPKYDKDTQDEVSEEPNITSCLSNIQCSNIFEIFSYSVNGEARDLQCEQRGVRHLPDPLREPPDHWVLHRAHQREALHHLLQILLAEAELDWVWAREELLLHLHLQSGQSPHQAGRLLRSQQHEGKARLA